MPTAAQPQAAPLSDAEIGRCAVVGTSAVVGSAMSGIMKAFLILLGGAIFGGIIQTCTEKDHSYLKPGYHETSDGRPVKD